MLNYFLSVHLHAPPPRLNMSYTVQHIIIALLFILLLSPPLSTAQPTNPNDESVPYARFSAPLAIILAILVAFLFFIGLFSIYIRSCSDNNTNGSTVNPVNGVTGRSRRNTRGLEASVLETFPTMVYSEVKIHKIGKGALECAVCLNEFEDDETLRLIPNCDHVFHTECIDAWLASHITCPVCRANLAPQPGDSAVSQLAELENTVEIDLESGDSEREEERRLNNNNVSSNVETQVVPEVDLIDLNRTLNKNRTRGSRSSRSRKFSYPRSHSTGHSLVQPGQNTDRFTLRLPVGVRNKLINRELNRQTSLVLPKESTSRRGYRAGEDGGSSRGKSFVRVDKMGRGVKSDRWLFSKSLSFFNRASSMKSPKVAGNNGEGTSSSVGPVVESSRPKV